MRCPRCGNEVSQEEAFCGQCGAPNTPSARSTETVRTPSPPGGPSGAYNTNTPFAPSQPNMYNSGMQSPPTTQRPNTSSPASRPSFPNQPQGGPSGPNQPGGFYKDATEAISALPNSTEPRYSTGYQQPGFPNTPTQGGYPVSGQYDPQMQPFQTGNYTGPGYQQTPFTTGQGYEQGPPGQLPPRKQQNSAVIIIACICLVITLISVVGFGTLYLLKGRSGSTQPSSQGTIATATPLPTATTEPSPTPTTVPTDTPTPAPTLTPTPDTGFLWCTQAECAGNGFLVEYPSGWQIGPVANAKGVLFTNPAQQSEYAAFKTSGPTTRSAGQLVTNDLQTNFSQKTGYATPTPASTTTTTISGETWATAVTSYEIDTQKIQIAAYATVHQGKGYIIELQAPSDQFDSVNTQYFVNMLGRFQFQQSTS